MIRGGNVARRGTAVAAGIVVACGAFGAVGAAGAAQQAAEITIGTSASEFVPDVQQIDTGDTVVWQMSAAFHNVKADTGPAEDVTWADFHTTPKNSGEERRTFGVPGTYTYHCEVHPGTMTGTLEVVGAPVETPTPTPTTTATATPAAGRDLHSHADDHGPGRPHHDAGARRVGSGRPDRAGVLAGRLEGPAPCGAGAVPPLGDVRGDAADQAARVAPGPAHGARCSCVPGCAR